MNLAYNDITPESAGTFIRELLCSFVNKEPSIYNNVLHDHNEMSEIETLIYDSYKLMIKTSYNHTPKSKYTKMSDYFLILDNRTIYLKEQNVQRMDIKEFDENKFALSTILSNESMYTLKCSTYFSDIDFGSDVCAILIGNILDCYYAIHTTSL